jgi:hypothetical protein
MPRRPSFGGTPHFFAAGSFAREIGLAARY